MSTGPSTVSALAGRSTGSTRGDANAFKRCPSHVLREKSSAIPAEYHVRVMSKFFDLHSAWNCKQVAYSKLLRVAAEPPSFAT